MMISRILLFVALTLLPANAEDFDAAFAELSDLPQATIPSFKYKLSLQIVPMQSYIMKGRINGVTTQAALLRFRGESPERIPGDGPMKFASGRATVGDGTIDFAATQEYTMRGMPEYPPDKPAAAFRFEVSRLLLVNDEVRVRIRFKDSTQHYLVRYEDEKGLRLVPLSLADDIQVDTTSVEEFSVLTESEATITWHCNALTTWATDGDKLLWSTDVPMEGQPKSMKIVGEVLFVTTTAGHSFYIRKDTGEVAFYDKSILPGSDPMEEVLELGRDNMAIEGKRRSLARFITAAVVLNDHRSIPFLIDCIERGDSLPVMAMAIAALEKFNGNPDLWEPKNRKKEQFHYQWVLWARVDSDECRRAETAKWREVFAADLDN